MFLHIFCFIHPSKYKYELSCCLNLYFKKKQPRLIITGVVLLIHHITMIYLSDGPEPWIAAWAAAKRATGMRFGEQLT